MDPRASYMISTYSTAEIHPSLISDISDYLPMIGFTKVQNSFIVLVLMLLLVSFSWQNIKKINIFILPFFHPCGKAAWLRGQM
jgi:hypothetical protein